MWPLGYCIRQKGILGGEGREDHLEVDSDLGHHLGDHLELDLGFD